MNLNKILNKLNKIEKLLENINKEEEQDEPSNIYVKKEQKTFMGFENKEVYYYILSDGLIMDVEFDLNSEYHKSSIKAGLFFKLEEEAIKELKKCRALVNIRWFIEKNEIISLKNYNNNNINQYSIAYNGEFKHFCCESFYIYKGFYPFGYFETRKDVRKIIDNCEEDLKIIFDI